MRYDPPRLLPAGDSALLIEYGDEVDLAINTQVHALARVLGADRVEGLGEAVPTYRSLLLHYDAAYLSYDEVAVLVRDALSRAETSDLSPPRVVEVPTCYGGHYGPDLEYVAQHSGLSQREVVDLHSSVLYPVFMLGFSPGFAYLGGLAQEIATPRLASPRTRVPAGSVGIAGMQTGIYPIATPGGWQIIGRTPLQLFDPGREAPARLRPGDRVRFVPTDPERYEALWEQERGTGRADLPAGRAPGTMGLEVVEPGLLTTVQDLGRRGHEGSGVPVAGAMDTFALRATNCLVGNPPDAAGLEMTIAGPVLRSTSGCIIAVGGADLGLHVNGLAVPPWMSAYVRPGWTIEFRGRRSGCRAYLAVAGGIAAPAVMGSRSTYLAGGFGGLEGRALRAGDLLPVGPVAGGGHLPALAGRRMPDDLLPAYGDRPVVAAISGPQGEAFTVAGQEAFYGGEFQIGPTADRMGYRLQGPAVAHEDQDSTTPGGTMPGGIVSDGIPLGAVQVPPDRQPIVMMADRQTTGGYAKIAVVASADIPLLAQCVPGKSSVRIKRTSVEEAQRRYRQLVGGLERLAGAL
jgi:KipI family sensor histidine kinase inhibitor